MRVKGRLIIAIFCLVIFLNGCAMLHYAAHIPKQEVVLLGKAKTESGTITAVVKKWTFQPDEKHNTQGDFRLTLDITNQSRDTLSLSEYVITTKDGQEIRIKFSNLKPTEISATEERVFEAKSFSSFDIETEPLLSLIQSGQINNLALIFKENKMIPKGNRLLLCPKNAGKRV